MEHVATRARPLPSAWRDFGYDSRQLLDAAIAFIALVALAPLYLLVALCVSLTSRGPVLFRHRRIGKGGRSFDCLKFRTMVEDSAERLAELLARDPAARAEWEATHKLRNDPRITPLGAFLRQSSLDELPQLFNVLLGEMSLVGPRPIVAGEVHRYGYRFRHYCSVRPGLTGLWQVMGRSDTDYRTRVAMDVTYVATRSLLFDFKILLATVPAVLLRRGSC